MGDSKKFTVTTTTTPADDNDDEDDGEGSADEKKKKIRKELQRYQKLYGERVEANLALGPKPNGNLLPGGSYLGSADGCNMIENPNGQSYDMHKKLDWKKTLLHCTHTESRMGHLPTESYVDLSQCPLLRVLLVLPSKKLTSVSDVLVCMRSFTISILSIMKLFLLCSTSSNRGK